MADDTIVENVALIREQLSRNTYLQGLGFSCADESDRRPIEGYNRHVVKLACMARRRELWVGLGWQNGKPEGARFSVSFLNTSQMPVDPFCDLVPLEDYLAQCWGVEMQTGFQLADYAGTFRERISEFLQFLEELLKQYAEPILRGEEWPSVTIGR